MCGNPKSVAVVGRGYVLNLKPKGKEIDKHDLVIRVNYLNNSLDEKVTGLKTDISAYPVITIIKKNEDILKADIIWNINPCHIYDEFQGTKVVNLEHLYEIQSMFRSFGNCKRFDGIHPTSGLVAIWCAFKEFPNSDIYCYGFDFYKYKTKYYRSDIKNSDEVKINRKDSAHDYALEERFFKDLITKESRLKWVI